MVYETDKLWVNDLKIIFDSDRFVEFVPTKDMSNSEKLNSIVRLSLYISIVLSILKNNYLFFYIFIFTLIVTYLIYVFNDNIEQFNNINIFTEPNEIESNKNRENCVRPTKDNPFMNPLLTDDRNRGEACNSYYDEEIESEMNKYFSNSLYQDVNDVFNKKNSQRSFYTVPSTTFPNNQGNFANWLYKTPKTCKEGNMAQCVGNLNTPLYNTKGSFYPIQKKK
jgi:hypothetical protein